jgi:hypothetical protein
MLCSWARKSLNAMRFLYRHELRQLARLFWDHRCGGERSMVGRGGPNPKSEVRNPKEGRNPKSEFQGMGETAGPHETPPTLSNTHRAKGFFGFRASAFLRPSDFGLRISRLPAPQWNKPDIRVEFPLGNV